MEDQASRPSAFPFLAFNYHALRFALNYKHLPFETVWVEYPDIEPSLKKLGIKPNADGVAAAPYSVPMIIDSTNPLDVRIIMESTNIAEYLDKTYSSRPLFRGSTASLAAQKKLMSLPKSNIINPIMLIVMPSQVGYLNPSSAEYFRRTREAKSGNKLEELVDREGGLEVQWRNVAKSLQEIAEIVNKAGDEGLEVLFAKDEGVEEPTYAAFVLVAAFVWIQKVGPPGAWDMIMGMNGGRWKELWDKAEPYMMKDYVILCFSKICESGEFDSPLYIRVCVLARMRFS